MSTTLKVRHSEDPLFRSSVHYFRVRVHYSEGPLALTLLILTITLLTLDLLTLIPGLHDTAGCQTVLTTVFNSGCFFSTVVKPVVQPGLTMVLNEQPLFNTTVRSTGCQTGLYNWFDNWLYTRYGRLSNRLSNGFDNRLNIYTRYKRLSNRLYRELV